MVETLVFWKSANKPADVSLRLRDAGLSSAEAEMDLLYTLSHKADVVEMH